MDAAPRCCRSSAGWMWHLAGGHVLLLLLGQRTSSRSSKMTAFPVAQPVDLFGDPGVFSSAEP